MTAKFQAFFVHEFQYDRSQLFLRRGDEAFTGFTTVKVKRSELRPALLEGDDVQDFLQAMLNVAWDAGLRPKSFEQPTSELKAVRDHLQDMRKLVFDDKPQVTQQLFTHPLSDREDN